ncbi:MAG: hypothetical protein M1817_004848 [Caeruleum heppii]|nr:MAG: hypothetical protein M1817_004848 [Caeruleum heppii]
MSEIHAILQQQQTGQNGQNASNGQTGPTHGNEHSANSTSELIPCQWNGCTERCRTAELLYDHICEQHVGRKSTNNLNLTCAWGTCRTTTVKRDHITSHIRVHVPLKPHKCDFCGKSFKRPQDLKKHVKTHADDSVILRSPEPVQDQVFPSYRLENGKGSAINTDLQALAATATGYYDTPSHPRGAAQQYAQSTHHGNTSYYGSVQHQPSYGPVYYAVSQGADLGQGGSLDSRKRGFSALNDFFGDVKRRQIDPTSYSDVGQRLMALQGLPIPSTGGALADYSSTSALADVGGHGTSVLPHHYALPPMPNLRTKNDLMNIDQFLDQMQSTVYESSNHLAAAGVAQPGVHSAHGSLGFRQSRSPPSAPYPTSQTASSHASTTTASAPLMVATSSSSTGGTPALTPPSSTLSHVSAHSPTHGLSPAGRISTAGYPTLPAVTMSTDMTSGYHGASLTAPASVLGTAFDNDQRRRYSGGILQKAAQPPPSDEMDVLPDGPSSTKQPSRPSSRDRESLTPKPDDVDRMDTAIIDPALTDSHIPPPSPSLSDIENARDRAEETWVENIRLIEHLRRFIQDRLDQREYDEEDEEHMNDADHQPKEEETMKDVAHEDEISRIAPPAGKENLRIGSGVATEKSEVEKDAESLYPVLRAVEESRMEDRRVLV